MSGFVGKLKTKTTFCVSSKFLFSAPITTCRNLCSQDALSGTWMSTSVCSTGTRPLARTFFAMSNCWSTTRLMPTALDCKMMALVLTKYTLFASALSNNASRSRMSFDIRTPPLSFCNPESSRRIGVIFLRSQRNLAVDKYSTSLLNVSSPKMVAITRAPLNLPFVMKRERISWILSMTPASSHCTPYFCNVFCTFVAPWSSAAKNPSWLPTLANCSSYSVASRDTLKMRRIDAIKVLVNWLADWPTESPSSSARLKPATMPTFCARSLHDSERV
mmetsp:Transcript_28481/g.85956  ORF Transcript_28481/g.85956 Transcript_28481/m.85956 type:complete len:275 (-) Transcript_28481:2756-3580(-)